MRVLAVSHSAVVPINCRLYETLAAQAGWEVHVLAPATWPSEYGGDPHRPEPGRAFTMHALPAFKAGSIPLHGYRSGLRRLIGELEPDIAFLDEEPYSVAAAQVALLCWKQRLPYVLYTKQNLFKRYPPPFSWTERGVLRNAANVLALSGEVESVARAKGWPGECPHFPHAVDLDLFHPPEEGVGRRAVGDGRSRRPLATPVIGYLGRLTEAKGIGTLAQALVLLGDREWSALVVGSGPAEGMLREILAGAGLADRLTLPGPVRHDQAANYLRAMDLLVVPSRTTPAWMEQFGRVIIEALACGVPVVGSESGHIPELLRQTGGGWIFPEGDERSLALTLRTALDHPEQRHTRAEAGLRVVRERFSYPAIARQLATILAAARREAHVAAVAEPTP